MNAQTEWTFPSSSSSAVYTARIGTDGKLLCNCKGWTFLREGRPRHCKHTREIVAKLGVATIERDGYVFIGQAPTAKPAAATKPITTTKPAPGECPDAMLASAMTVPVTGSAFDKQYGSDEWALEEKLDGHRCLARVSGGTVRVYSRHHNATDLPKAVVDLLATFPDGTYDGEKLVAGGNAWDVSTNGAAVVYVIFDVVELRGEDLRQLPYSERRARLLDVLQTLPAKQTSISTVESVAPSWERVQAIWKRGGEGAILKRLDSRYRPGYRTPEWVKVKQELAATLTITGFVAGKSGPYSVLALRDSEGNETTIKTADNAMLRAITAAPESFIGRQVVITYQQRTPSGSYRHGRFDHWAGEGERQAPPPKSTKTITPKSAPPVDRSAAARKAVETRRARAAQKEAY